MPSARRSGRVMAMQTLFEIDAVGSDPTTSLETVAAEEEDAGPGMRFAGELVTGALQHRDAIDAVIAEAAPQWPLDQIARVDKSVLRVAIYELLYSRKAPPKVVINEAVDIAKSYGGEGSGRFVNGVLGHVVDRELPKGD